jgi:hypothetical protein
MTATGVCFVRETPKMDCAGRCVTGAERDRWAGLSAGPRLWFVEEGVDLDDPRVVPVRRPDGETGEIVDFDVAGDGGLVQVRFDRDSAVADGQVVRPGEQPSWVITCGPDALVGARYDVAGEAVRAALRGEP